MNGLDNFFLIRVWNNSKPLAIAFLLFIMGQAFFTYKGVETFPFLHWGMYSAPIAQPDTLKVISVKVGTGPLLYSSLSDPQRSFAESAFKRYYELYQTNGKDSIQKVIDQRFKNKLSSANYNRVSKVIANDSLAFTKFPAWYMYYIADMRLLQQASIEANVADVQYNKDFSTRIIKSSPLFYYAAE